MRSPKVLEKMATGTLAMTKGQCQFDLLAIDDDEVEWFTKFLRGKHNTKLVGIVKGRPGDEVSLFEKMDSYHAAAPAVASTPARAPGTLTEDGY